MWDNSLNPTEFCGNRKKVLEQLPHGYLKVLREKEMGRFVSLMYLKFPELLWIRRYLERDIARGHEKGLDDRAMLRILSRFDNVIYKKNAGLPSSRVKELLEQPNGFYLISLEREFFEGTYQYTVDSLREKAGLEFHPHIKNGRNSYNELVQKWEKNLHPYPHEVRRAQEKHDTKELHEVLDFWTHDLEKLKKYIDVQTDHCLEVQLKRVHTNSRRKFYSILDTLRSGDSLKAPSQISPSFSDFLDLFYENESFLDMENDLNVLRKRYSVLHSKRTKVDAMDFFIEEVLVKIIKVSGARMILSTRAGQKAYYQVEDKEAFIQMISNSLNRIIRMNLKSEMRVHLSKRTVFGIDVEKRRRMNTIISESLRYA